MKALEDFMRDMGWQHDTRSNRCNVMTTQNVHDSHYYSVRVGKPLRYRLDQNIPRLPS